MNENLYKMLDAEYITDVNGMIANGQPFYKIGCPGPNFGSPGL